MNVEPTRETFLALCAQLAKSCDNDQEDVSKTIDAVEASCRDWPARIRMAPLHWILDLIHLKLPVDVLRICSGLSLAPACFGQYSHENKEHYGALFRWISELPPTCPPLEGLHLGLTHDARQPIEKALGDRIPSWQLWDWQYEKELIEILLSSPLASTLRVLDLSIDSPNDAHLSQDTLNGRGLSLDQIAKWLASPEHLEVLDLYGQYRECGDYARSGKLPALSSLVALDLGGGHPFNTRDTNKLAKQMAKSSLRHLNLAAGPAIMYLDDSMDEVDESDLEYFNIEHTKDLKTTGKSMQGLLHSITDLRTLILSDAYRDVPLDAGDVEVQFAPWFSARKDSLPSHWTQHFEV